MGCKHITGYPDYEVTSEGYIISHKFGRNKKLKGGMTKGGYLYVNLLENGKQTLHYVSRLVATAFIGLIGDKTINHKDCNKLNNNVGNLEIVTQTENMEHAFINKLHPTPKKPVKQIDKNGNLIAIYESQNKAARETGIDPVSISRVVNGKSKMAGGFLWLAA